MKRVQFEQHPLQKEEGKDFNNEVRVIHSLRALLIQINVLKTLRHPNVVKYYESFVHKSRLCIVMDYAENGKRLPRLT